MRTLSRLGLAVVPVLLGGCEGVQSALDPAGDQAGRIAGLFWLFLGVLVVLLGLRRQAARPSGG
jgi:hypothetical protein